MGKYAASGKATNTTAQTILSLTAVTANLRRIKWAYFTIGSDATPNDNAAEYVVNRCSTAGTAGSNPTARPLDAADGTASTVVGLDHSAEPTVGVTLFQTATNQRATFQWYAAPGYEMITPATDVNGATLEAGTIAGSSVSTCVTIHFEE